MAHEEAEYEKWRLSGSLIYAPREDGRGPVGDDGSGLGHHPERRAVTMVEAGRGGPSTRRCGDGRLPGFGDAGRLGHGWTQGPGTVGGTGDSPSPFGAGAPTLDGELGTEAPPLAPLLANACARLSGLRLADGTLILKIENPLQAAQVRLRSGPGRCRRSSGCKHWQAWREARELLTVLDARLAGKSWRETAVDLYGAQRVAAEWHRESWMRARVRRRDKKARFLMEGG